MVNKELPVYDIEEFKYLGTESNFYANTFKSHLNQHHQFILAPHRHNFYISVLFTKGSGTHEIEFNTYNIKPGSVFLLAPGEVHDWHLSKNIDGYIIFHTKEFYDLNFTYEKVDNFPFFCCLRNYPLIPLRNKWREDIERIFCDIVEEYHHNELLKFQKIASLVNVLYIVLSRIYLPKTMMDKQNLNYLTKLKKLENLLDKHFKEIKYPKDYAQMMHLSEKHLNRICKICLGKTTSGVIIDRIVLEAKRMLVFSGFTVSQIAAELGYTNNSYFFRLFKKRTGKTPLEFMNEFRRLKLSDY
jgi:AraC family transcriptional activator of pobA